MDLSYLVAFFFYCWGGLGACCLLYFITLGYEKTFWIGLLLLCVIWFVGLIYGTLNLA